MRILQRTYVPVAQSGPEDVRGRQAPMVVNLPPAVTLGDQVAVRFHPSSTEDEIYVLPNGSDEINGLPNFAITVKGKCVTFMVGTVGRWWVISDYVPAGG